MTFERSCGHSRIRRLEASSHADVRRRRRALCSVSRFVGSPDHRDWAPRGKAKPRTERTQPRCPCPAPREQRRCSAPEPNCSRSAYPRRARRSAAASPSVCGRSPGAARRALTRSWQPWREAPVDRSCGRSPAILRRMKISWHFSPAIEGALGRRARRRRRSRANIAPLALACRGRPRGERGENAVRVVHNAAPATSSP